MVRSIAAIDAALDRAVSDNNVPGIVAMAADRDKVFYTRAVGTMGVDNDAPMPIDAIHRIFSMTKPIGTLAAVKLIEDGMLELDTPVSEILPDFAELLVLEGFDGDTPIMRAPASQATIRQLATHTSGLEFETWSAKIARYLEVTGQPSIRTGLLESLNYPLSFDPGTSWGYGTSTDWLGRVVEKVSGKPIDVFCREFLFEPLGMNDTVFECVQRSRLVTAHSRDKTGALMALDIEPPPNPEFYGMGRALFSTAPDYMRFLQMLLGKGTLDGVRILKPETVAVVCENHMGNVEIPPMNSTDQFLSADLDFLPGIAKRWGLGFASNTEDIPGMRAAGSQSWAGILNSHMWWDPTKGVAGVIFMQNIPFLEDTAMQIYRDFERAVYASGL